MCLPGPGWINSVLLSLILTLPQTDQGQTHYSKIFCHLNINRVLFEEFIQKTILGFFQWIWFKCHPTSNPDYQKLGNRRLILLSQILDWHKQCISDIEIDILTRTRKLINSTLGHATEMRVFVFWTKKSDIKTFRYLVVTNKPFDGVNEAKLLRLKTQNWKVILRYLE